MKITQAVILAGGEGKRLRPYTLENPKPMFVVLGKPFLEYLVENLKKNGIKEIVILVGYLHEKIEEYFGDGSKFGVSIKYSFSPVDTDTGLRLKNALPLLKKKFILLYGDNMWPLNLKELNASYTKNGKKAQMVIYNNKDKSTNNNVLAVDGIVKIYSRNRDEKNANGVDIGFFIFDKSVLKNLPNNNFSLKDIIIDLVRKNDLAAFTTDHKYYSLTSIERVPNLEKYLSPRKIIFLDRDGVINKKAPKAEYITKWNDFVFLPKVLDALALLQKNSYEIYIISNQPGIARKAMTAEDLENIHENMLLELKKNAVEIRQIYVCTHGWDDGCWCRKPRPGMLYLASYGHMINLKNSIFIGDDIRDKQAGDLAGCKTYLLSQRSNLFDIVKKYL